MKNSKYLLIALSILSLSACSNVSKYSTDDVYNTLITVADPLYTKISANGYVHSITGVSDTNNEVTYSNISFAHSDFSDAVEFPLYLSRDKEDFDTNYNNYLKPTLVTNDSASSVMIDITDEHYIFSVSNSNQRLTIYHTGEADTDSEISARWNLSAIYSKDGYLIKEEGFTLNWEDSRYSNKCKFEINYTYAS